VPYADHSRICSSRQLLKSRHDDTSAQRLADSPQGRLLVPILENRSFAFPLSYFLCKRLHDFSPFFYLLYIYSIVSSWLPAATIFIERTTMISIPLPKVFVNASNNGFGMIYMTITSLTSE